MSRKGGGRPKHDWAALEGEWLASDPVAFPSLTAWGKSKGFVPSASNFRKHTQGWVKRRKEAQQSAAQRAAQGTLRSRMEEQARAFADGTANAAEVNERISEQMLEKIRAGELPSLAEMQKWNIANLIVARSVYRILPEAGEAGGPVYVPITQGFAEAMGLEE